MQWILDSKKEKKEVHVGQCKDGVNVILCVILCAYVGVIMYKMYIKCNLCMHERIYV